MSICDCRTEFELRPKILVMGENSDIIAAMMNFVAAVEVLAEAKAKVETRKKARDEKERDLTGIHRCSE